MARIGKNKEEIINDSLDDIIVLRERPQEIKEKYDIEIRRLS